MDQTQWDAISQMLAKQAAAQEQDGLSQDQQYRTVPAGQPAYAFDTQGSSGDVSGQYANAHLSGDTGVVSYAGTPDANPRFRMRPGARQGSRPAASSQSQLNGGAGNVVKSLLTGQQYVQPGVKNPQSNRGLSKPPVNAQQLPWQQQQQLQQQGETGDAEIAIDKEALQQMMFSDALPEGVAPGEKVYVFVDGVAYEIVTGSEQEQTAHPSEAGEPGISLEDLANISAEQATLKLVDYQPSVAEGGGLMDQSGGVVLSQHHHHQGSGLEMFQGVGLPEGMQLVSDQQYIEMQQQQQLQQQQQRGNDVGGGVQKMEGGGTGVNTVKMTVQEWLLTGQPLPQELQDLIAQGVDVSDVELVIQDDDDVVQDSAVYASSTGDGDAVQFQNSVHLQQQLVAGIGGATNFVTSGFGEFATAGVGLSSLSGQPLPSLQMLAPEDEDDGEFAYLVDDAAAEARDDATSAVASRPHPNDAFLDSFLGFVRGDKPETLSNVANSAVGKRPALPMYDPALCRRTTQQNRWPAGIVGGGGGGAFGTSRKTTGKGVPVTTSLVGVGPVQKIDGKSAALPKHLSKTKKMAPNDGTPININRKRKISSDEDSLDDSDGELERISGMSDSDSDPVWKPKSQDNWQNKFALQLLNEPAVRSIRGRGRGGRGRPRGRGGSSLGRGSTSQNASNDVGTVIVGGYNVHVGIDSDSSSSASTNPTDAHKYQKGDFVVERKDAYKTDGFPVWKIEVGRLLQKYDPLVVVGGEGRVHRSASVYSSWSGDIRTNFKAITVELVTAVSTGHRYETVKVDDKCLPKPYDDSLEQDTLMELFNIYVQNMTSQALDPAFLLAIQQQEEEYYLGPLRQIDGLLLEAQQTAQAQVSWTNEFKTSADAFPYYKLNDCPLHVAEKLTCQATGDVTVPAVKSVRFYGPMYNEEFLETVKEAEKNVTAVFYVGRATADSLAVYHALHHLKFLLFKKCQEEVQYLKLDREKSDELILGECLQNRIFVQQCLRHLKALLEKCSIVITVVTNADEDDGGGGGDDAVAPVADVMAPATDATAMVVDDDDAIPAALLDESTAAGVADAVE